MAHTCKHHDHSHEYAKCSCNHEFCDRYWQSCPCCNGSGNGNMTLAAKIEIANETDDAYEAACKAAGYKSRWDWNQHVDPGPEALRAAYRAKVTADNAMHAAFEASRAKPAFVDVSTVTEYGLTQKLSNAIRVF